MHSAKSSPPRWESASVPPYVRPQLTSRSAIWRYDFFNHAGSAEDYAIMPASQPGTDAPGAVPVSFHRVAGVAGPEGETSLAFESSHPILLTADRTERFMLLHQSRVIIADLPTPGLDFSRMEDRDVLCSRQFIYL